jgi:hypothetical protein
LRFVVSNDRNEADEAKEAGTPSAEKPRDETQPPPPARRRDPRFRLELIERLPKLGFESWSAKEDFKIDEQWAGIVSLHSDAILGPLEPLAPDRRVS